MNRHPLGGVTLVAAGLVGAGLVGAGLVGGALAGGSLLERTARADGNVIRSVDGRTPRGEAIFAGGCFWCEETAFEGVPGVSAVVSGYTGGTKRDPTYEEVSAGGTGHAESVKVTFDPSKISYAKLLDLYWHNVDPFSVGGQFCDRGSQYRSAIFYLDDEQKKSAEEAKRALEKSFKRPIATEITAATTFYPAEEYHQDYYKKNPVHYQTYRLGCGRDRRLKEIWGASPGH